MVAASQCAPRLAAAMGTRVARRWPMVALAAAMMTLAAVAAAAASSIPDAAAAAVTAATPTAAAVTDGIFVPSSAAAATDSPSPSPRLAASLRAYLHHSPLTRPAAAATFDADDSMAEPSSEARSAAAAAVAAGAASPAAHQLHSKLHALRRRGQLLRKYGRLSTPGWAGDAPDVASLRTFGMHESTPIDAAHTESDPALIESLPWRRTAAASASAAEDDEEADQREWEVARQQAQLHGRPKVTEEFKRAVQFSVQSAGSGGGGGAGVLAPAPWELQPSLAEQEGSLLVDETPATDIRQDTARVAARLGKPDIGTSSPQKDEVRRRTKTADLQLPAPQISQIILWTKQHILWMVASLGDHLPAEAVAAFPKPTRNELYGYVYSLFIDPTNPNSWVDSLSNDFDDMLLLQVWQYKTFQNFFDWIQISTVLFSLREETNFPLSPIQKRRLWTRYTGLFREDINIINLGEEGELRRYVTWKWQLEYVGEVLSERNTEEYVAHLLALHAKMRAMDIRPGLIKYYTAMFIEKLAKFRLDYTYDAAAEYWSNTYRAIESAMQAAGVEVTPGGASYRGQKRRDPTWVTFDPSTSGLNRTALQQIEDAGIPSNQPFDPYTVPINVLTLIETDLSKLQGTAIASISNYLQWHAKFHGNWQEDMEVAADQMSDQAYLNDPEAAAQRAIIEAQPTGAVSNAAAAARVRKQVAEGAAKTVSTSLPSYSFRDISSDSDFGALMPGFVESDSNAQQEGMGSSRVGALLEAQAAAARARLARQEEEARLREEVAATPEFEAFRAQSQAPDTRGREKHFIKRIGLDSRGIPHVQPLSADMPASSWSTQKRGRFQTMSAGGAGSEPAVDPACVPLTTEALRTESAQLRVALQAQVDSCSKCWPQMRATHVSSIDSLLAAALPVTEATTVSELDACSLTAIRERLHSTVATALYTQLHFLQPYYLHLYGSALAFSERTAADDLEFLYLFSVQVAQNHLHKEGDKAIMNPEQFAALQHNHVRDWCALLLQLAVSHPRTRAPASESSMLAPQFQWRSLLKHVHEILNWGWYQSPRTTVRLHAHAKQQPQRDLRHRHSTHVGLAVDGIVQMEVAAAPVVDQLVVASQVNHTASYTSGTLYAAAARGARTLMSSQNPAPFDEYADSYSDGMDQPLEEFVSDDSSLLESRLSAPMMSARTQLRLLLHRANVSESLFDLNGFLRVSTPSSFQVLAERLIVRLRQIFMAFQIDNVKSWHSDRSKSPSASYDFDPSIHEIDFLVWLDSMNYNPAGHLGLDTIAVYAESNVEMINKKVSADDKYTRETHLRNQVPPGIWLRHVSAFEKWRWSWTYPQSKQLFTRNQEIVFNWLEGWGGTSNMKLGALVAWVSSTIWALLQIVRYLITKPWERSSLVRNGSIHYEQKYHEEYERRERSIVLFRVLPINILTTYIGNFMMCTFILALNFSYYNPLAMFFYLAIFRWLTSVIFDVYALKFFMYLVLFVFPKQRTGDLKPPLCACSIPLSSSCMILNPIRPANDDQLRQAVRKQIDLLWAASSQHIISILILQAEGNLTSTFRRYEGIIRELMYDDPDVPQHVKDRFFVFHVAEVTKPHNMFKVMHWFFMRSEQYDPVTREFLFGMDTSAKIERTRKVVRRAPYGRKAPAFATLGNAQPSLAEAHEMDATDIELLDDKDLADPEHEAAIAEAVAKARKEKAQKIRQQKMIGVESASSSSSSASSASSADSSAANALTPEESAALLQRNSIGSTMNRWAFAITGAPESAYEEHEVGNDPRLALLDTEAQRRERVADKAEKQLAAREARAERRKARLAAQRASKAASADAAGSSKKVDPLLPNDSDFPDELNRVVIEDTTSDSDDDADLDEDDLADPADDTEAAFTALKIPRTIFHSTYEPLVYLGGQLNYRGYEEMGADSGIMCTVQGLHNLLYLRNEANPGGPLLENFAVLDADNYVEPVTLLRMLATMTDDYMIWQPCIKFYNRDQSMYAYMKDFTNEHLGHFMNIANVWMYGGIRSFGKYFGRLKRFYYEECTADSCATAPEQYSFLFNICSGLITMCMMLYCIRPLGEEWLYVCLIITPILTVATCGFIWYTHRKLRKKAFDVSSSTDPDIGKGEHLLGFGPIQGDAVVDDFIGARSDAGAPRKSRIGEKNRERRKAAIMGDSRRVTARFQNMFPLNRLFIQSEDSRHGGPFGRAVYLMDDAIHESTPISPLDDNQREYSKWLPTFDMRDFLLLHTPMLWILQHLTLSVWLAGGSALSFAFIFAISFLRVDLPSSLVQVWCFMLCMASCALCWAFWSLRSAMTEPVLLALRACRFPEMPERAQYTEDLMIRGIWSETIWLLQFVLGIFCLLVPGTVEIAYPFLGEFHLLVLLVLLIHPKFTAPLLTRLHFVFHPKWKGYWRSRDAVLAANEKAKKKGLKTLMKKGKHHLVDNLGGAAAIKAAAGKVEEEEVVGVDDDGNQILQPKSSKAITADALYELSKANNLTHTCLFETGSFNVCGRNLPKWNHDASLKQGEKYSKLKDKSGFTMDTRFMFRLPSLEECGEKLEISWEAVERKHRKIMLWIENTKEREAAAEAEALRVQIEGDAAKKAAALADSSGHMVAFPLGRADEDESASSSSSGVATITTVVPADEISATLAALRATADYADVPEDSDAASLPSAAVPKPKTVVVTKRRKPKDESKVAFPLSKDEEAEAEILEAQRALHRRYLQQRAATWMERQYIIWREKRWQPILQLSFLWLLHDLPVGIFEFTASTTVFGLKLLTKPPQVIWAMIGCCVEIKGLLLGVATPGTWPSFVESTQTLPLSRYIQEYHVPMGVSLVLFFLCIPSMPGILAASPMFTSPFYLALLGLGFGALLGLWPAWNSFDKLRTVVRNRAAGGWAQLRQLRWIRESWSLSISLFMFFGIFFFAMASWMLRGSFPAVFFIRSFPILIASFVLGPGIAWLLGMSHGVIDHTTNPPRYRKAYMSMILCVGVGMFILVCAGMFVLALAQVLLPLQRAFGAGDDGGGAIHHSGGNIPTGDGTAAVILPFSLTYGEMIKAPWYFLIPYAGIVYGSMLLAVLAWPSALFHQVWSWWFYSCTKRGKAEGRGLKAYNVDDLQHQTLKEKRAKLASLEKAGASKDLVKALAAEAIAAAAAAEGRFKSSPTIATEKTPADASSGEAPLPIGAGMRAQAGKGRRGAVSLAK